MLVGALVVVFAYVLATLGTFNHLPRHLTIVAAAAAALLIVVNVVNRWLVPHADPVLMPVVLVLNGLGFVMIYRLQPFVNIESFNARGQLLSESAPHIVGYESFWTLLGVGAYVLTLLVVRRSRDLERYRYLLLFLAIGLLVMPLVPHLGDSAENLGGVKLWVKLGPISFQPFEASKLLLVIFFASYFVEKKELLSMSTHRVGNHLLPDLRPLAPIIFAWLCSVAVILLERDIGFSLLLFVLFLAMLWVTTGRWLYIVLGVIAFAAGTYLAAEVLHQINQRVEIWLDPWKYLKPGTAEIGLQPALGELGLAQGGLSGTGLGLGDPGRHPCRPE